MASMKNPQPTSDLAVKQSVLFPFGFDMVLEVLGNVVRHVRGKNNRLERN